MPTSSSAQLFTIEQLADQLATSIRHIRRLVAERRVPYIKVGGLVRFDPSEVEEWIDQHRVRGAVRPSWPSEPIGRLIVLGVRRPARPGRPPRSPEDQRSRAPHD